MKTWTFERSGRNTASGTTFHDYLHGQSDENLRTMLGIAKSVWMTETHALAFRVIILKMDITFVCYSEN